MEVFLLDDTSQKIMDATMKLVRDKGYTATTTKDIAKSAGVNECTLFRKFANKKDIVLQGMNQEKWRANVTPEVFQQVVWNLQQDLEMFMTAYMERVTADFVKLSIGLRAPQLYEETAPLIMQIPQAFVSSLMEYFEEMEKKGLIPHDDYEYWAMTIFSSTFGYTFLKASFGNQLDKTRQDAYIRKSVAMLVNGIPKM